MASKTMHTAICSVVDLIHPDKIDDLEAQEIVTLRGALESVCAELKRELTVRNLNEDGKIKSSLFSDGTGFTDNTDWTQ